MIHAIHPLTRQAIRAPKPQRSGETAPWSPNTGFAAEPLTKHLPKPIEAMNTCETCGNHYAQAIQVTVAGQSHWFDCFECATLALARTCMNCGGKVIGHGAEADGKFFCCLLCAKQSGEHGNRPRRGDGWKAFLLCVWRDAVGRARIIGRARIGYRM